MSLQLYNILVAMITYKILYPFFTFNRSLAAKTIISTLLIEI